MTTDQALALAWTHCAPSRSQEALFPRGFWPDVARVAVEIMRQGTSTPVLDFRPTKCERGNAPAPRRASKLGLDLGKLEISI
jgi:hypothetical protein